MADRSPEYVGVDRGHAIPLYHQIFLGLRDEIISGVRAYGEQLPTEPELEIRHGVSRITARRALMELARQGFVERRRRVGTRVIYGSPTTPIEANIDQALESLLAFGRRTRVRVLGFTQCAADAEIAKRLGVDIGAGVIRAVRIRLLDNDPLGEVVSHMPSSLGLEIRRADLTQTPMLALLQAAGHSIGGGQQTISAGIAGSRLAKLLSIDLRAPVLRIERTVFDPTGQALLTTRASYRADRYCISLDLQSGHAAFQAVD